MRTGRTRKGAPVADTPVFDALFTEAQQPKAAELVSLEELDRRRPLIAEDHALASEYLDLLDRLEAEQDAEVTDVQSRLLNVVLVAAHHLRGEPAKTLAGWAEYSGLSEGEIRAAVTALQAIGLDTNR